MPVSQVGDRRRVIVRHRCVTSRKLALEITPLRQLASKPDRPVRSQRQSVAERYQSADTRIWLPKTIAQGMARHLPGLHQSATPAASPVGG